MFNLQPVSERITGMMSNIISTLSEVGDKLRHYCVFCLVFPPFFLTRCDI